MQTLHCFALCRETTHRRSHWLF